MFGSVLGDFKGYLDSRFLVSVFLPCLVFCTFFIALAACSLGLKDALAAWGSLTADVQTMVVVFYLSFVYLFSFLLSSSLGSVIRLYEGYWDGLPLQLAVKPWKDHRIKVYQGKLDDLRGKVESKNISTAELVNAKRENDLSRGDRDKLNTLDREEGDLYQVRYLNFPPFSRDSSVMPTAFGNVMKSWELYPLLRYNMSTALTWPRLYPLLGENEQITKLLIDARVKMESMVVISVLGVLFAVVGTLFFAFIRPSWMFFLIAFWGGLLVWWLAYRSSIDSARVYGEIVKVAYDLYRHKLAASLRMAGFTTLDEERKGWQKVNAFLYRNKDYGHVFDFSTAPPAPGPKAGAK